MVEPTHATTPSDVIISEIRDEHHDKSQNEEIEVEESMQLLDTHEDVLIERPTVLLTEGEICA